METAPPPPAGKSEISQLFHAAKVNDVEEAKRLLASLGDSVLSAMSGKSHHLAPIHLAAAKNAVDVTELCISRRSDLATLKDNRRGLTPLHLAAMHGHLVITRLLAESGVDLEVRTGPDDFEATAALLAAFYGHTQVLEYLLDQKPCLIDLADCRGNHAIHWAAAGGNIECVDLLLSRGVSIDLRNEKSPGKYTPLHLAAAAGCFDLIRYLILRGVDLTAKFANNQLAIHLAAHFGHRDVVQLFTEADDSLFDAKDDNGCRPFHRAVLAGHLPVVALLIFQRVYVDELGTRFGRTSLHMAADKGHLEIVKLLLENGANPYARSNNDDHRQMPIHLAAYNGHLHVIEFLLEFKPDLADCKNTHGDRAIHVASLTGQVRVVEFLLKKLGQSAVELRNNYGRTPLHCAAQVGQLETAKLLVQNGAKLDIESDRNDDRRTPIHMASSNGHVKIVDYFLQTKPELIDLADRRGMSIIHRASLNGQIEVVEMLLKRRLRLLFLRDDVIGRTPLHYAAQEGHLELVKVLVNQGADVTSKSDRDDDELLPIHLAAHSGHANVVDFLLEKMPSLIDAADWLGNKPIHSAALGGQTGVIEFFVKEKKVDIETRDTRLSRTALHCAAEKDHAEAVKVLLANGATAETRSGDKDYGQMAVHMAAFYGNISVLEVFLEMKKELLTEAKDLHGNRPIHSACLSGKLASVEFLLNKAGADIQIRDDKYGRTPLHCAAEKGHVALVKALVMKHGADITARSNSSDNEVTPLHLAAFNGHVGVVEFLGRRNSRVLLLRDGNGDTALEWVRRTNKRRDSQNAIVLERWIMSARRTNRFPQCKIS